MSCTMGEQGDSVARHIRSLDCCVLCQHGLFFARPNGGMEVASQGVVWTAALCLSAFPFTKHLVVR